MTDLPLVSIPVITYNSSKTIVETLDSIYNQTYQNIELIVSDDCSTDNTVEICRQWISNHNDRFYHIDIIEAPVNTGISANMNRAEKACNGEWVKGIAGDDIMLPECISDCINYILNNNGTNCLFGKIEAFGEDKKYCEWLTETFSLRNDTMAKLSRDELYTMILKGETPPAPAFFYNRIFFSSKGIINDERIPNIEDLPKWLNILNKGVVFAFLDKRIVRYRIGGFSTSSKWDSLNAYKSKRLLYFYYQFEPHYTNNLDNAIKEVVDHECKIYQEFLSSKEKLLNIKKTASYRIGHIIITPFRLATKIWGKNKL